MTLLGKGECLFLGVFFYKLLKIIFTYCQARSCLYANTRLNPHDSNKKKSAKVAVCLLYYMLISNDPCRFYTKL